jgi:hypothetical protein
MNILNLPSGSDNALLQAGSGISYNSQTGTITNSGVRSITGTTNQVNASASTGEITLSLPQSIGTDSQPLFARLGITDSNLTRFAIIFNQSTSETVCNFPYGNLNFNIPSNQNIRFINNGDGEIMKIKETGGLEVSQPIKMFDNVKINMGDSSDFQIWHDGSTTNNILTGAGRDLVFKSETTSAFNYKFQNHSGTDLFKITGAGVVSIPSFSNANRVITTTGSAGELTSGIAYDTANTANAIVQRDSNGDFVANQINSAYRMNATTAAATDPCIFATGLHASYASTVMKLESARSGSAAFNFWQAYSQGDTNSRAYLTGVGQLYIDGSVNSPADIAEYFESTDASALTVGRTVILSGGKVRYYNAATDTTDQIIGVVRPKGPGNGVMLVGNAYSMYWSQKFLTDDYDAVILNGAGEWTKNPSFDPDAVYVSRENRNEWNLIGLLGQIKITNGQTVNPRWMLMSSGSVASKYLVR